MRGCPKTWRVKFLKGWPWLMIGVHEDSKIRMNLSTDFVTSTMYYLQFKYRRFKTMGRVLQNISIISGANGFCASVGLENMTRKSGKTEETFCMRMLRLRHVPNSSKWHVCFCHSEQHVIDYAFVVHTYTKQMTRRMCFY